MAPSHDLIRARVSCDTLGPMPPLEALWAPERLRMRDRSRKRAEWQSAVSQSLTLSAQEADSFLELDRFKKIAIDCALAVLGTT
jgi:hypothetical protein